MATRGRILVAHDLSCRGNASLGIVIPVLTAAGYEVVSLPTVLLSSTTDLDYKPISLQTTSWMRRAIDRFKSQDVEFDAIYTGWLGDVAQVEILVDFCQWARAVNPAIKIFVDPVLGDGGELYPCQSSIAREMYKLVAQASMIFPNPTEAALLCGYGPTSFGIGDDGLIDKNQAPFLMEKLAIKFSTAIPVLTSVATKNKIGVGIRFTPFNLSECTEYSTVFRMDYKIDRPSTGGTGDLFASLMIACCLEKPWNISSIKISAQHVARAVTKVLDCSLSSALNFRCLLKLFSDLDISSSQILEAQQNAD